jgi:BirA family biotin operon repressor/biotin-[acetyl-CoA-carboxylase] ligase
MYYPELTSTNDYMMGLQAPTQGLSMVVTDYQTKGKGQAGRTWVSEMGGNLLFSILYHPKSPMEASQQDIEQFTLEIVRALAVALGGFLAGSFDLKPPNDLYLNGKKVCGILSEVSRQGSTVHRLVVGIGLNVNQRQFPEGLRHPATSLALESGCTWNRERLLGQVIEALHPCFETLVGP